VLPTIKDFATRARATTRESGLVARETVRLARDRARTRRKTRAASELRGVELPSLAGQQFRIERRWAGPSSEDGPTRRLLVLHVPKTAGTSFRQMLEAHVSRDLTFMSTGANEWANASVSDLGRYTLFVGHNFLEPLYMLPADDWVTVLPVREPLAWWRSFYTYTRGRYVAAGNMDHPMVRQSMGEWLDTCQPGHISNGQAAWLLARTRLMFDNPAVGAGRMSNTGVILRHRPVEAVQLLDRLLDQVTVLGVTEDIFGLYGSTCEAMGWTPVHERPIHDNVSVHDPELVQLTDAQEERLRDRNRVDQYLYDRARQRVALTS